jgi:hypothetical protein
MVMSHSEQSRPESGAQGLSALQMIQSVAWSFFGVQSERNRERDFKQGNAVQFIGVGIAMTAGVVLLFWLVVRLALRYAGVPG